MEQLQVKKFLVIKNSKFDIGKVNIIIGPQANGKSILVKLLYFFRETISESLLLSVKNNELQKDYIKRIEKSFEKYFPQYTWKDNSIEILYTRDDIQIKISKTETQRKVQIELSEYIKNKFKGLKSQYKSFMKQAEKKEERLILDDFWQFKVKYIQENKELSQYFSDSTFIPASRTFFATLQKNIFSFLAENIDIDPFMKEFGSKYESIKQLYTHENFHEEVLHNNKYTRQINLIVENILNGKYEYKDKQDWIKSKNGTINLAHASSGQQESLPMLLILSVFPFFNNRENMYFIEEPEAHLFPISQKHLVSLFGLIYNNNQNSVITTHSPYVLTALNNLLLAYDVKKQKGEKALKGIIDKEFCISFDDIRAYTIEKGKLISIMDKEERLIGMNIIDSVSDEFSNTFDTLLAMQDYE